MIVVNALIPVFSLILIGAVLGRIKMPGGGFWPGAERLTYFVFFPSLLIHILAAAEFTVSELFRVSAAVILLLTAVAVALLLFARWLAPTDAAFTSVFQGATRFNTYVGLAAVSGLWGEGALPSAAVVVACMVPFVNFLCIAVFALKTGKRSAIARQVALNPLIIACAIGLFLNFSGIRLPGRSADVFEVLGRPALPLGLLSIGVALSFRGMASGLLPLLQSSAVKLILLPLLAVPVCRVLNLGSSYTEVLVLFFALPTASSAYILARQLDGDASLMASIITFQTLAAMITIPMVLGFALPVG